MMSASNAAVTAPTDGPNHSVAAKTNGSETDNLATRPGIFTVNDPVRIVRAARAIHDESGGCKNRSIRAQASMRCRPTALTLGIPARYWTYADSMTSLTGDHSSVLISATRPK